MPKTASPKPAQVARLIGALKKLKKKRKAEIAANAPAVETECHRNRRGQEVFAAKAGESTAAGYIDRHRFILDRIRVSPGGVRGAGIGGKMLKEIERLLRERNKKVAPADRVHYMRVFSDLSDAEGQHPYFFYRKQGWVLGPGAREEKVEAELRNGGGLPRPVTLVKYLTPEAKSIIMRKRRESLRR